MRTIWVEIWHRVSPERETALFLNAATGHLDPYYSAGATTEAIFIRQQSQGHRWHPATRGWPSGRRVPSSSSLRQIGGSSMWPPSKAKPAASWAPGICARRKGGGGGACGAASPRDDSLISRQQGSSISLDSRHTLPSSSRSWICRPWSFSRVVRRPGGKQSAPPRTISQIPMHSAAFGGNHFWWLAVVNRCYKHHNNNGK